MAAPDPRLVALAADAHINRRYGLIGDTVPTIGDLD